jgi:hypothetical protein
MLGGLMSSTCARAQVSYAPPYTFITIAGTARTNGTANGLNGAGLLNNPYGITVDTNDNLYVVDFTASTVVKVAPAGGTNWMVTTIAGSSSATGSTDGTGTGAVFDEPTGIAMDSSNNLYVMDSTYNIVRKLTLTGGNWVVKTIAGSGNYGSDDGTNRDATFKDPEGLAADAAGNLYVADTYGQTIRRITPVGTNWVVTTIAGTAGNGGSNDGTNGDAQFFFPAGIAVDASNNLYVTDSGYNTIREITPVGTNWVVKTIAGTAGNTGLIDGTNGDAEFNYPLSLTVDSAGNLYVADTDNNAIRKVSPVGTNWVTTTLAGAMDGSAGATNGIGSTVLFDNPYGITVDHAGRLFVSDTLNGTIREGTIAVVPNPAISITGNGGIMVAWPGPGGTLQTNADLTTGNWGVYGGAINSGGGTNSVTFPPASGSLYFRLTN